MEETKAKAILTSLLTKLTSRDNTQTELPVTETYLEVPPTAREEEDDSK